MVVSARAAPLRPVKQNRHAWVINTAEQRNRFEFTRTRVFTRQLAGRRQASRPKIPRGRTGSIQSTDRFCSRLRLYYIRSRKPRHELESWCRTYSRLFGAGDIVAFRSALLYTRRPEKRRGRKRTRGRQARRPRRR